MINEATITQVDHVDEEPGIEFVIAGTATSDEAVTVETSAGIALTAGPGIESAGTLCEAKSGPDSESAIFDGSSVLAED